MKPWEYERKPVQSFSLSREKAADNGLYQPTSVAGSFASCEPEVVRKTDNLKGEQRQVNGPKGVHISDKQSLSNVPEPAQRVCKAYGTLPVALPPILLKNLMAWVAKFHELRISHPDGNILNATPEHVRDAVELHPWGVVYNPERYLLVSWGDVPTVTLLGLRDLETGELLIPEQVAA